MDADQSAARRLHYGEFYGLRPPADDGRPLAVVHGNCQAESLRVLVAGAGPLRTVRLPPVHEMVDDDLPHLARTLARAQVLVSQPVRADYRGLALGTAQLATALPSGASIVQVPVIRYAGLFPYQAIIRAPGVGDPPVVPYHDLRTLVAAATGRSSATASTPTAYRAVERYSVKQLRSREQRHGTVVVSDLLRPAGVDAAHTINHPGNPVLRGLAHRVLEQLGYPVQVDDPGRTLLDSIHAPLAAGVLAALGLAGDAREDWVVRGEVVPDEEVRRAQLQWYAEHESVVQAGLSRHSDVLALLGLT